MKPKVSYVITCEHAARQIPRALKGRVALDQKVLQSHRSMDYGALPVAQEVAKRISADLYHFAITRLLIDGNRSLKSKNLFSKFSRDLPQRDKDVLVKHYQIYRKKVWQRVKRQGDTVIFSLHSFTPVFKGKARATDIGLLFRPSVPAEFALAKKMRRELRKRLPDMKIHFNLPYRGHTDCFLNDITAKYAKRKNFVGLFLEVNNKHLVTAAGRKKMAKVWSEVIAAVT